MRACFAGSALEAFDVLIYSFVMTARAAAWAMPQAQAIRGCGERSTLPARYASFGRLGTIIRQENLGQVRLYLEGI